MRKYYKHKESNKEFVKYESIQEGVLLTSISEGGLPLGNSHYKFFVRSEDLKMDYDEFEFQVPVPEGEEKKDKVIVMLRTMFEQLNNYGQFEDAYDEARDLEYDLKLIEDAIYGEFKDKSAYESYIERRIKETYPEDYADDVCFSEATAFFHWVYEVRNQVRAVL